MSMKFEYEISVSLSLKNRKQSNEKMALAHYLKNEGEERLMCFFRRKISLDVGSIKYTLYETKFFKSKKLHTFKVVA